LGELTPHLPGARIDFCSIDDIEDGMTVTYLFDTAQQARLDGSIFPIAEIGWDGTSFLGPDDQPLSAVFKLYPWEWMLREEYGGHLGKANTIWIEPPWKMLLSNKGILPVLWTLYPNHPNLLPAYFDDSAHAMTSWVKKPLLGREGANITLHHPSGDFATDGEYGSEGFIYQQLADIKSFRRHVSRNR
jgi:glutathionylspermidine synthase